MVLLWWRLEVENLIGVEAQQLVSLMLQKAFLFSHLASFISLCRHPHFFSFFPPSMSSLVSHLSLFPVTRRRQPLQAEPPRPPPQASLSLSIILSLS
ncbi:hypothetical protein RIF29_30186 [Crotalaria pallida]|uniref:Uncharacterized protein n=1 Tax=Crotalaria pallida TaxID=3830 RepID=A0AAN9EMQ8_CROPI